jgi:hypothetical protein
VRGASNIISVLSNPRNFDFVAVSVVFLTNVLGLPSKILKQIRRDNSGIGFKPFPGTSVRSDKRFHYLKHKATHDVIGRSGLPALLNHFEENLNEWVASCDVGHEWVDVDDLWIFIRDLLFRVTVDSFFGPAMLRRSPHLVKDLWEFDTNLPFLVKGFPKMLRPDARGARDRCVEAVRGWRAAAKSSPSPYSQEENWDPNWGLKCMNLRDGVFSRFEEWDEGACASSDLAILWA